MTTYVFTSNNGKVTANVHFFTPFITHEIN